MRKFLTLFSFFTFVGLSLGAQAATPSAQSGPFGLGVILGEPTGVTLKYDTSAHNAIDAGVSFRFDRYFMLYGDYHFKFPGAFNTNVSFFNQLTPYVGVGAVAVFENEDDRRYFDDDWDEDFAIGVRIPLGIEWRTPKVPLGVFAEIVPGLAIIPGTDAFVQGGIGVRYFF